MNYKRGQYIQKLIAKKENHLIKVITGVRRCGKSYLLFNLFKQHLIESGVKQEQIIEIQFDDYGQRQFRNADVLYNYVKNKITGSEKYYILLDEVQLLENFEDVLNGFLHIPNVDVYVTGSNAKFLSKDIITEFRGRGDEVHISPLCFSEFMENYSGTKQSAWREFISYGSLPLIAICKNESDKKSMIESILHETYLVDLIERNKIKNDSEFEELLKILASGIGSLTNPQKLSDTFKSVKKVTMHMETIKKYIDYFCDAFMLTKAERYDIKGKRFISTPAKYYFSDLGVRNALLNFRQIEETHLMENALYNELTIRGYNVDVGVVQVNYSTPENLRAKKQLEVDFVCNMASQRLYIQSALSIPDTEKQKAEESSLLRIKDAFRKIIITKDDVPTHNNENGILIMNLFDFLLDANSLER